MNKILLIFIILSLIINFSYSQIPNPSNIDPKSLSDNQVKEIKNKINQQGLTQAQAMELARQRGATESQIQEMVKRLQQNELSSNISDTSSFDGSMQLDQNQFELLSKREAPIDSLSKIFGSSLFNSRNLTFEPSLNIQTPKNYIIGIGDILNISIWGSSQNNYQVTVDNNGHIVIPDLGPIYIAGLTYDDAILKIKERLSGIYSDMTGSRPKTFAQINMAQLRSIKIDIVGEVVTPGTYTLPVTSSVFNALYLSGGPNSKGSFRCIKIIRDGVPFKEIDIYDYLINADASGNIQLQDGDVIYVPTYKAQVSVNNGFIRSGLFEIKEGDYVSNLINYAGGFKSDASMNLIQVRRKTQKGFSILDVNFKDINTTTLQNGDTLSAGKIINIYNNRVFITGAVYNPGEYECSSGLMLSQLIQKADSITPGAFLNRALIIRLNPDSTSYNIPFNLRKVLSGKSDISLQPNDSVIIKSKYNLKEDETITIRGEVIKPGRYQYFKNMNLEDIVFLAGGLKMSSDTTYVEIARPLSYKETVDISDTLAHVFSFAINRDLEITDNNIGFELKPYDEIFIRRAPGYRELGSVIIKGEVKFEGSYAIETNRFRISDLIRKTGGFTNQAYIQGASLTRYTEIMGRETVGINMTSILKKPGTNNDLVLQPGDEINIPKTSQTIKITGHVQNQISATFVNGKKLKHYINQAGGYKERARKSKVFVVYANGTSAITKRTFFIKNSPKIEPGCNIIAPEKPKKIEGDTLKWISTTSALTTLSIAIVTLVNLIK